VGISERVTSCVVGPSDSDHVLDGDREFGRIVDAKCTLYVDLDAPTRLWHQNDHRRELEVAAGVWRVVRKLQFEVQPTAVPDPRALFVRD
jgi:hypothetical protein